MTVPRAVLLPSPLLPARAYGPLADALGRRGWDVVIAPVPPSAEGPVRPLLAFRDVVRAYGPDLVVAHSNAGRYGVGAAGPAPVVYVDAALPPEQGEATLAPQGLLEHLADLADRDGLLPPWTRWWGEEDLREVLPDAEVLAGIREDEQRMPLSYFRSRLGAPPGWVEHPQAYLAFGATYADETAFARAQGWPTTVLGGALHLHHLVDPDAVAAAVLGLAAALGAGGVRPAPGATTTE